MTGLSKSISVLRIYHRLHWHSRIAHTSRFYHFLLIHILIRLLNNFAKIWNDRNRTLNHIIYSHWLIINNGRLKYHIAAFICFQHQLRWLSHSHFIIFQLILFNYYLTSLMRQICLLFVGVELELMDYLGAVESGMVDVG